MSSSPSTVGSLSGTYDDVAALVRRSRRTVERWVEANEIGCFSVGGTPTFFKDHIVEIIIKKTSWTKGLSPADAEARAEKIWREHLGLRAENALRLEIEDVKRRLSLLEKVYHISQEAA